MNEYVLIISIGPVQGFISAARRSRDLWSGSWLLSEMAKACAKYLHTHNAVLIFPAPEKPDEDLEPDSPLSVGNKIQAVITAPDQEAVRKIAEAAQQAAKACFKAIARQAKTDLTQRNASGLRNDIWNGQVDDYVEAQAAWARIENTENGYGDAVDLATRILAARKATRDFAPSPASHAVDEAYMLPKSSLDGARETVLLEDKDLTNTTRRKLGLSASEQLDCAGIAKRLGGDSEQFTPYSRVAAHSWLKSLPAEALRQLKDAYEPLVGLDLATRVKGNNGCYKEMPFDGQYCYRFRLESAIRDNKSNADCSTALQDLLNVLKPLWKAYGQPCPYGVLLLADGDRMGELLDKASTKAMHQKITRTLSAFAGGVSSIVRRYEGHAIYAGGDDVLAFVPLNTAYDCAKELSEDFRLALQSVAAELGAENAPTLSVGLGISHIMEPLGNIRELAKTAEKAAKGDDCAKPENKRNALGITLDVRSGATTTLRIRWDDTDGQTAFKNWIAAYTAKSIPSRVAYDTRTVHERTRFAMQGALPEPGIPKAEFKRMLDKARTRSGEKLKDTNRILLETRCNQLGSDKLDELANELILARWFAAKTAADLGREQ